MKYFKQLIAIILSISISLVLSMITLPVSAEEVFSYVVMEDGYLEITGYNGASTDVEIPREIDGKTVSRIGEKAFEYTAISSVIIPDTVISIGEKAFNDCVKLTTVQLPSSLEVIGKDAFFSCTRLTEITLPSSLHVLGDGAFYDCQSVTEWVIPGSIQTFGEYVFGGEEQLKRVVIEDGITVIPVSTFFNCDELTQVQLPETIQVISRRAFANCNKLSTINLPASLEEIGKYAFKNCWQLSYLDLGDSVRSIDPHAFDGSDKIVLTVSDDNPYYEEIDYVLFTKDMKKLIRSYNRNLTDYEIPESVQEIGENAFKDHYYLSNVTFPSQLKKIGEYAFVSTKFYTLSFPETIEEIGEGAFSKNSSLVSVVLPNGIQTIQKKTFAECSLLESVILGDGVEIIEEDAFTDCWNLQTIQLSSNLKDINKIAFANVSILDKFNGLENTQYILENGILYNSDKTEIIIYENTDDISFTVPETVTAIHENAFLNASLQTITIPDSVSTIGSHGLGYSKYSSSTSYWKQDTLKIIGSPSSTAHQYALDNNISYYTELPVFDREEVVLNVGETYQLSLSGAISEDVQYSSGDTNVAVVDDNGLITAKGSGNTSVVVVVSGGYYQCNVTVNGEKNVTEETEYQIVTSKTVEQWENDYFALNTELTKEHLDYPAIHCYSSSQYTAIVYAQSGSKYKDQTLAEYGEDYKQYFTFAQNLSYELSHCKLHSNTVLYSGTSNIDDITGMTSSYTDMKASIGKKFTSPYVISTTLSIEVGMKFLTNGQYPTLLVILAPEGFSNGTYMRYHSHISHEYEFLLDKGITFEIVDAGYKEFKYSSFPDYFTPAPLENEKSTVRYMVLKIVEEDIDDPVIDPTPQPEITPSPNVTESGSVTTNEQVLEKIETPTPTPTTQSSTITNRVTDYSIQSNSSDQKEDSEINLEKEEVEEVISHQVEESTRNIPLDVEEEDIDHSIPRYISFGIIGVIIFIILILFLIKRRR